VLAALAYLALELVGLWHLGDLSFARWVAPAALVGAVLGALGGRMGRRVLWGLAGGAVALVVLVTATPIMAPLARGLVRRDLAANAPLPPDVDAVVVLSGGQLANGVVIKQGLDRLLDGLRLARAAGTPAVVTVIHPRSRPEASSLPDQRALATLAGVAPLFSVDSVHSTHDEALGVARLVARQRWRRVALVTSPLHSRRACATFEHAGVRLVCTPAQPRDMVLDGPDPLPGGEERAHAFGDWLYERIGAWTYRARGWI